MISVPGPLIGRSLRDTWMNRLRNAVLASRIRPGVGYRIRESTFGTTLEFLPSGGGGISISAYQFVDMSDEFIEGYTWDGKNLGTQLIKIAKPMELRFTVTQEIIAGDTWNYTGYDTDKQLRVATRASDSFAETQYITKPYLAGNAQTVVNAAGTTTGPSIIWAAPMPTFTDPAKNINLMDLNIDGRCWAVP